MLCINYLQDPVSSRIAHGFEYRIARQNYKLLISVVHEKPKEDHNNLDILGMHGITGIAVIGGSIKKFTNKFINSLVDAGVKVVLVSRELKNELVSQVLVDNYGGARLAAKHLYDQGAEKIWVFKTNTSDKRVLAVKDYANSNGHSEPFVFSFSKSDKPRINVAEGHRVVLEKLEQLGPPDGIIANGDYFAYGAIKALTEAGYCVGRDVGVIGFGNLWQSEFMTPPLTTIHQPMIEMGHKAADILIDTVEGTAKPGQKFVFTPKLIVRKSGFFSVRQSGKA